MPAHVMIDTAKLAFNDRKPLEVTADCQLIRHAHAAMGLDRILANEARRLTDTYLG